jgi:hypothetical protein
MRVGCSNQALVARTRSDVAIPLVNQSERTAEGRPTRNSGEPTFDDAMAVFDDQAMYAVRWLAGHRRRLLSIC